MLQKPPSLEEGPARRTLGEVSADLVPYGFAQLSLGIGLGPFHHLSAGNAVDRGLARVRQLGRKT